MIETDDQYRLTRVVERSGRYVFRAWLPAGSESLRTPLVERLTEFGALTEVSSRYLLAIDAETEQMARDVSAWLAELEARNLIQYETGQLKS